MPKRSSKRKDTNEMAFSVVQQATGQAEKPASDKNPAAVALGRLGGKRYPNAKGPRKPRQLGDAESDLTTEDQGLAQLGYEPPEGEALDSEGGDMTQ